MDPLTDLDRDVLAFERLRWNYAGAREAAIRERFGLSAARYAQLVLTVIDKPAALAAEPVLVKRLRRLRDTRRQRRSQAVA